MSSINQIYPEIFCTDIILELKNEISENVRTEY